MTVEREAFRRRQAAELFAGTAGNLAAKALAEIKERARSSGVDLPAVEFVPIVLRSVENGRAHYYIGLRYYTDQDVVVKISEVGTDSPSADYTPEELEFVKLLADEAAHVLTTSELELGL